MIPELTLIVSLTAATVTIAVHYTRERFIPLLGSMFWAGWPWYLYHKGDW